MGLESILKIFTPKDRVFYSLFEEVMGNLKKMGVVLIQALNEKNRPERDRLLRMLDDLEHDNDDVTHRIFIELGRNFITPFDREDIHALATALDDVADYTWGTAKRILNYQVDEVDETMQQFAVIIDKCISMLHTGVHELRNMRNLKAITDACVGINSLENEADDLFDRATVTLFTTLSMNPIELIKRKDLYQEMEIVTDKCEDAANVIESIIVKYS
jgi:predicted phosphate transport protein (TIGR00153 family)